MYPNTSKTLSLSFMYTLYDLSHCARALLASNQCAMLPRFMHTHTHTSEHIRTSPSLSLLLSCSLIAVSLHAVVHVLTVKVPHCMVMMSCRCCCASLLCSAAAALLYCAVLIDREQSVPNYRLGAKGSKREFLTSWHCIGMAILH